VASIFVRMDYREMTRLYPVGSLLLVDQRARPYNGCTVVALVDNATIVVRRYTAGNNTVVLSSWSYDAPSPDLILDKRRVRIIGVVVFFQASHDTEAL
jgi:SOS-response transcriptional repressor LexA